MAVLSTVYFSSRMYYMLGQHGVDVTQHIHRDILHLQVQFLTAMLALNFILLILILMVYRYMKFREYTGELDFLTGIMGRRLFLHTCLRSQKSHAGAAGWFLVCDLDLFQATSTYKYGHSVGDEVLKQFAEHLQTPFVLRLVGRIGGDEFAVIMVDVNQELSYTIREKITVINNQLYCPTDDLPAISLSVGVAFTDRANPGESIFKDADKALYRVKQNGKHGCGFY